MTSLEIQPLTSAVKWSDDSLYLKDFIRVYQLPHLARVTKGQYSCVGVPGLISDLDLSQSVLLHSSYKAVKVLAQCVRIKDVRKGSPVSCCGPTVSIPSTYKGWFEVLSEEGKAVKPMESIAELAAKGPESFLVRENCKALVGSPDACSDKSRLVLGGEVMTVTGPITINKDKRLRTQVQQYLHCKDCRGESVFLSYDQRGLFSPIAKEENISGVHTIRDILGKFRLPLMVRLVIGALPYGTGRNNREFTREIRLLNSYEEECVLAHPLDGDATNNNNRVVTIPITVCLKLTPAKNQSELMQNSDLVRYNEKCTKLLPEIKENMQVCEESYGKEIKVRPNSRLEIQERLHDRSVLDTSSLPLDNVEDDVIFKEIDDIYGMVVRGIVPLKAYTQMRSHGDGRDRGIESPFSTPPKSKERERNKEDEKPPLPPRNGMNPAKNTVKTATHLNHLVYCNNNGNNRSPLNDNLRVFNCSSDSQAKLSESPSPVAYNSSGDTPSSKSKYSYSDENHKSFGTFTDNDSLYDCPEILPDSPPNHLAKRIAIHPPDPHVEPVGNYKEMYKFKKVPNPSNRLLNLIHNSPNPTHSKGVRGSASSRDLLSKRHSTAGIIPLAHSRSQPMLVDVRHQSKLGDKKRYSLIDSNGMRTSSSSGSDGMKYNSAQDLNDPCLELKMARQDKIKAADQRLKRLSNFFL